MANETTGSPVHHLPWAGKRVRIDEVDTALASFWKMSADNMRIGANLQVRTSVLNLVICAPDVESAHAASSLLRDLASTHIARATIAMLDGRTDAPDAFASWVTLRCFSMISDVMRHCFEQTTLLTSGRATRLLTHTLPGVLKAHLPVYLWWIGDIGDLDDSVFRSVAALCERVIVDSATFFQPGRDIRALATYNQSTPVVALSDLNWSRLTPWRQLVIQFFDMPHYLPFLAGIERIEIEYVAAPLANAGSTAHGEVSPNPTSALLLAGWLNARLNLKRVAEQSEIVHDAASGTYQWSLNAPSGKGQTLLQIQPHIQANLHSGSLYAVRLICKAQNKRARFTIERDGESDYVLTSADAAQTTRLARTVNLPDRHQEHELLRQELEIMGHDQLFEQALQELVALLDGK